METPKPERMKRTYQTDEEVGIEQSILEAVKAGHTKREAEAPLRTASLEGKSLLRF